MNRFLIPAALALLLIGCSTSVPPGAPATASPAAAVGSPSPSRSASRRPLHADNGPIEGFGLTDGVRIIGPTHRGAFAFKCRGSCTETVGADWSPDGSRLAFSTACGGGCASAGDPYHGIRIAVPARGTDRLVVGGEPLGPLAWSPDGARIAFVALEQEVTGVLRRIEVMNTDGSGRVALTPALQPYPSPSTPSWSPDGARLVYATGGLMYIVGLDGSAPTVLAGGAHPAWSPDRAAIAYLAGCEVRLITPAGLHDRGLINVRIQSSAASCDGVDLVWSPNGKELAAMVDLNRASPTIPSTRHVLVLNVAGNRARVVSSWRVSNEYLGLTWP